MNRLPKEKRRGQLNNQGSTLVTTLVVMLLLVVLGTILMSVSAMNYRTKAMDRQAKLNFYENEQALDDIYNGIGQEAAVCLGDAYTTILTQVSKGTYTTETAAYQAFCNRFATQLSSVYSVDPTDVGLVLGMLEQYALKTAEVTVQNLDAVTIRNDASGVPEQFVFEGVQVQFINTSHTDYQSVITTDIVIDMPYIRFFDSNDEVLDYSMIANQGIYFMNADREIEGNLYGGVSSSSSYSAYTGEEGVYGGINFYRSSVEFMSKYIVTKGSIRIRQSNVVMDNGGEGSTNVWAESIQTTGGNGASEWANVDITGRVFVANDLEVNARNSSITMKGSYYGYNNGVYITQESASLGSLAHTESSAIIVNQRMAKLNLSGLNTLIIAGKAYMDFGSEEQSTGESIALKSNQIMYMVPDEFMTFSNPITGPELSALGLTKDTALLSINIPSTWFGYTFLRDGARVQYKTYQIGGITYYYYYLNFSDSYAEKYAEAILNATEPADTSDLEAVWKWKLKQRLEKRLFSTVIGNAFVDQISIDTGSSDTVIYGKGTVVTVSGTGDTRALSEVANTLTVDKVTLMSDSLIRRYEWLYYFLNSKEELPLVSSLIPVPNLSEGYVATTTTLPLDNIVKLTDLNAKTAPHTEQSYHCGYRTIVSKEDVVIDSHFKGIILCAGNVTVNAGCNVEGLIMAGGRIIVLGDGTITANRSIVQTILDEELKTEQAKAPSEVDNTEYVLYYMRNYTSSHTGTTSMDVNTGTDYTDYISYQNWYKGDGH